VTAEVNPVVRGWGQYFSTGNAADKFTEIDSTSRGDSNACGFVARVDI
jgi:hypothetical protein